MFLYKTVSGYGEAALTIEKSKFIAHVDAIADYDEGQLFVSKIKAKYKDATHNVPAIIVGIKQEMQWASDDREPSGTAGAPVLQLAAGLELTNVAIVVTRYFGGIKLGTGGLVRAYSSCAEAGIKAAGISEVIEGCLLSYAIEYPQISRIQKMEKEGKFSIAEIEFSDKVELIVRAHRDKVDHVKNDIKNATAGRAVLISEKKALLKTEIR